MGGRVGARAGAVTASALLKRTPGKRFLFQQVAGAVALGVEIARVVRVGRQLVRHALGDGDAFRLLAAYPAQLLGVDAGELRVGAEADIAVIDPERPWIVDSDKMAAAAGNTPFDKQPVQGRVLALYKGGMPVGSQHLRL